MGFTDYLSRNPHQKPLPQISPDDELFVINRIREFTFTLLNEERKHNISTNQNAPFGQTNKNNPSKATQTETIPPSSNIGQGREPIDETKHAPLFEFENETPPLPTELSPCIRRRISGRGHTKGQKPTGNHSIGGIPQLGRTKAGLQVLL